MLAVTFQIEVDRESRKLTVFRRSEKAGCYLPRDILSIAVGTAGHETPAGRYWIKSKARHPEWIVPNSPWAIEAGLTPGARVPGGAPENPIRESFLRLVDDPTGNIGIHGTADISSLGTAASHGCIRVEPKVAVMLHRLIPINTPVTII